MKIWPLALALLGAACVPPPFDGRPTQAWLAFDVDAGGREPREVLSAFEASARAFDCGVEPEKMAGGRGSDGEPVVTGYRVTAYCQGGQVALLASTAATEKRVTVGCALPTTRETCEALVRKIAATPARGSAPKKIPR